MRAFFNLDIRVFSCIIFLCFGCHDSAFDSTSCIEGSAEFRFQIDENSPPGALVGKIPTPDEESIRYVISSGNAGNTFAINTFDGKIKVADSTLLDYERRKAFALTIIAHGPTCLTTMGKVEIQVGDLKE